jgi:hypothetical protein
VLAASIAKAAAQVVFPTPPLPQTNKKDGRLVFVALKAGFDADDFHLAPGDDRRRTAALALLDLADSLDDLGLELVEFLLIHLAEFDAHLGCQQLLAQLALVVQLGVDGGRDLVEDETNAADEKAVDDQHRLRAQGSWLKAAQGEEFQGCSHKPA